MSSNEYIYRSSGEEISTSSIFQSNQSISLSTIDNTSRAANSILTTDETVIRRGDGAQLPRTKSKPSGDDFDTSIDDVLTKIAIGHHNPIAEKDEKRHGINPFCCCLARRCSH